MGSDSRGHPSRPPASETQPQGQPRSALRPGCEPGAAAAVLCSPAPPRTARTNHRPVCPLAANGWPVARAWDPAPAPDSFSTGRSCFPAQSPLSPWSAPDGMWTPRRGRSWAPSAEGAGAGRPRTLDRRRPLRVPVQTMATFSALLPLCRGGKGGSVPLAPPHTHPTPPLRLPRQGGPWALRDLGRVWHLRPSTARS